MENQLKTTRKLDLATGHYNSELYQKIFGAGQIYKMKDFLIIPSNSQPLGPCILEKKTFTALIN